MRRSVLLLVSTALAAAIAACSVVLGSAAAVVCGPSWSTVPSAAELRDPRAIAANAPDDIWAVGSKGLDAQDSAPKAGVEYWDGTSWSMVPTPNAGDRENAFNGADALSTNEVWAVGYSMYPTGSAYKTLVERWSGSQWSIVPSPNVGSSSNTLVGVDALRSDLAWAVGYYRQPPLRKALILRWDGASWGVVPSPNPGTLSNTLLDVAAVSAGDAWAVGYRSSGAGYKPLVVHYGSTGWEVVSVPTFGTADNILTGVSAVSANDVWASGYYIDGTQHKTLTLHYNGTAWSRVPSANAADGVTTLRGIDASSPTNAWAVGLEYRADRNNYVATTQHWDGASWSAFPSAIGQSSTARSEMLDVAKAPGTSQVWAAGQPAEVESICLSESTAASTTASLSAQENSGASTVDETEAQTQPSSTLEASTTFPSDSVGTTASPIPVTALDRTNSAGISELTKTRGAVIADFDNDNLSDIFLGRHQGAARLYTNDGAGHFTEVNKGTFRATDRHGCSTADVNNDGLKDIFCATGAARGINSKRNELYVQRPDHTFVDRAAQYGVLEPYARGRSGTFVKANGDTNPDLFVANEIERADGMPTPDRLFINQAGGAFRYAPGFGLEREIGDGTDTGGNPDVADFDKDGWQDLLVEARSGLYLHHNNQGTGFTNIAKSVGLGQKPTDTTVADVNGDTWPDVIEVTPSALTVLLNTNGKFSTSFTASLSAGLAVAAGDVNGDGRSDIYVMRTNDATGANAPDRVYLNDGTGTNFTQMSSIPSASGGKAESVWPIDHDGNGLTDFLVLNGDGTVQGPVQLIAFFPK